MSAQTYGAIGDHWFSVVFLFVLYAACVVSVCRMSRRAPVREGSPPDPFSPGARRDGRSPNTEPHTVSSRRTRTPSHRDPRREATAIPLSQRRRTP